MKTFILNFLAIILAFISPIQGLILMMIGFILLDTIAGVYTTIRLHGKKSFRSGKLFNIVVKSFFYIFSVVLTLMLDKFVFEGHLFGISFLLSKSMTIFWTFIEIKSLDETSIKLGNKSFFELVKDMVKRLVNLKKDIKSIIE